MRYDAIPDELKKLPQWVNAWDSWKTPIQTSTRKAASSSNPDTWTDFETARQAVLDGVFDHIGFVFADNGIVGIDIDDGCYDSDGFLSKKTVDILKHTQSYTEKSKSGRGIHILVKGNLPIRGRNNRQGVEIYREGRYFIMTGKVLVYHEIIENQAAIDYIVETYFPDMVDDTDGDRSPALYSPIYRKPTSDGRFFLTPEYPPILEGGRNDSLASLAGLLHTTGYSKEQIYETLCSVNQSVCRPPLDDYEVSAIVNSITRYRR